MACYLYKIDPRPLSAEASGGRLLRREHITPFWSDDRSWELKVGKTPEP